MTTHYIDIAILPDPEFSHAHLMAALLSKLHRALVQLHSDNIGVSFPQHVNAPLSKRTLGSVLRLHGPESALQDLMALDWLKGMRDHTSVAAIAPVPPQASHRVVRRRQFKTSVERLRRRRMRRKGETAEQAAQAIPNEAERKPDLPFARLRSQSTSQSYALFVEHGPLLSEPRAGSFNTYGLSQGGSIPWF
jgi:CRISPR-associated endonuclease Csy4